MSVGRLLRTLLVGLALTLIATVGWAAPATATPPNIPSKSTALSELAALRVAAPGSMTGYSRDKFPHWITISGTCNTRETVLRRDGENVVTDARCYATSGSWHSPYDGATWHSPSDVDIDHVVPLANAWRSGAATWTTEKRRQFANDLTNPQLIAVTDNVNQAKGDQSPDQWKPPLQSYWCTYAKMWVHVKHQYALTITSSEKAALSDMLGRC
ncbi:Protein of unknown function (DUF1524) [Streptoalloteichus tenebrarius]|uniref:GmrSD restriction endonucleases C-terminal domain-containing protein n=1 Tax=Streptoalloteichus tenebrarius (strain ATCC 17920 / DSM 40477 / JCM 4838 / CBS 697.72 / NBRC 16177 / NCIMB 11028 / NRRL B-12390 / A12253. 1 / ISP 5477) TaxID=1933 RepID=A0ABT1I2T1_STRSD|nr:HNH endonuclease family protein [Streptoalloteichus tenebrarius]MCP2262086.1 Protein of unknown function (DUF1524) [Streptoalloteichus tenebrarius]BFF02240.1 HNH endonuclease family protein [Streptoalloteichus tenebrarius]